MRGSDVGRTPGIESTVEREDPDLVLGGVQSGDEANGATGVALAREIGFAWTAVVNDFEVDAEDEVARATRELEGGIEERLDVDLPAVLTIQTGINEPRYASLRGIRQAQGKPLDVLDLEALDVGPGVLSSPIRRTSLYEPETEGDAVIWEGDAEAAGSQLADFLRDEGVVNG